MHIPAHAGGPDGVETIVRVFAETVGCIVSNVDADRVTAVARVTNRAILENVFSTGQASYHARFGIYRTIRQVQSRGAPVPVETYLPER
ncbi:MAG: hypothetical protein ACLSDJ_09400 [Butyricimonas faecihominis]